MVQKLRSSFPFGFSDDFGWAPAFKEKLVTDCGVKGTRNPRSESQGSPFELPFPNLISPVFYANLTVFSAFYLEPFTLTLTICY